jgi:hypothetical protein
MPLHSPSAPPTSELPVMVANQLLEDTGLQVDDIKTEYHPNSGRSTRIQHFGEYGHEVSDLESISFNLSPDVEPWKPFQTRLDFEFAELTLGAALSEQQTNKLINWIHHYSKEPESFTISSHADLCHAWDNASAIATSVGVISLFIISILTRLLVSAGNYLCPIQGR